MLIEKEKRKDQTVVKYRESTPKTHYPGIATVNTLTVCPSKCFLYAKTCMLFNIKVEIRAYTVLQFCFLYFMYYGE